MQDLIVKIINLLSGQLSTDLVQQQRMQAELISDLRQYEIQLLFQASHDALTGLPNRNLLQSRIRATIDAHEQYDCGKFCVIFLDIDNFKDINNAWGHDIGDELLKHVALRITELLPPQATIARLSGDEFAALIPDIQDRVALDAACHQLLHAIDVPFHIDAEEFTVTCSIGVTVFPDDASDVETLLRNADAAMHRAKDEGKNNFRYFTTEMSALIRRRLDIAGKLRKALQSDEFLLQFQPRANFALGTISGVEALIRWKPSKGGLVSPAEFIPVAEENGLIVPIGAWVLHNACQQAASFAKLTGKNIDVAVNISARQFRDIDIVRTIVAALDNSQLAPKHLEIELTESMLMQDANRALTLLNTLKDLGVKLAIDDFGTGYSSLSYLKNFPIDHLKIDRSFIRDVTDNASDAAIVKAIIALAHNLGLSVIAEGVETPQQARFLLLHGCDEIQGFLFSRPLDAAAMVALLNENTRFTVPA